MTIRTSVGVFRENKICCCSLFSAFSRKIFLKGFFSGTLKRRGAHYISTRSDDADVDDDDDVNDDDASVRLDPMLAH